MRKKKDYRHIVFSNISIGVSSTCGSTNRWLCARNSQLFLMTIFKLLLFMNCLHTLWLWVPSIGSLKHSSVSLLPTWPTTQIENAGGHLGHNIVIMHPRCVRICSEHKHLLGSLLSGGAAAESQPC